MLSDEEWRYTWEHGRQLARMSNYNNDDYGWDFTYDAGGMRTQRSNGSTTYKYVYNGSQLTRMQVGGVTMQFIYGATGAPVALIYNGHYYYYVTNIQGDVIAILNDAGEELVTYTYDAWGNVTVNSDMNQNLGNMNPLRYRGYVYDQETKLYYLQSRYYNPEIGRFINADDISYLGADGSIVSYNLFAYCGNNPVMGYDPTGTTNWSNVLQAALVVITVTAVVTVIVATAGTAAVAAGVMSTTVAVAATTGAAVGGLVAGTSEVLSQCAIYGSDNLDYASIAIETFIGSAHGAIDGVAATYASVGVRAACKIGKIGLSAVGSTLHCLNQGKTALETLGTVGTSVMASIMIQGALTGADRYTGKLSNTLLAQYSLDGAMTYGFGKMATTAGLRLISNLWRNRNGLLNIVF